MTQLITSGSLQGMLSTLAASVGATSVLGGAVIWIFKEKIGAWVDTRIKAKIDSQLNAHGWSAFRTETESFMEGHMHMPETLNRLNSTLADVGQTLKDLHKKAEDTSLIVARQSVTLEFVQKAVESIDQTMDRRGPVRPPHTGR